jgi:hypothetical protein
LSAYNVFFREERIKWLDEKQAAAPASGATTFSIMGKAIGARWKQLAPEPRKRYTKMAGEDMCRYRNEMDVYAQSLVHVLPEGRAPHSQEPSTSTGNSEATDADANTPSYKLNDTISGAGIAHATAAGHQGPVQLTSESSFGAPGVSLLLQHVLQSSLLGQQRKHSLVQSSNASWNIPPQNGLEYLNNHVQQKLLLGRQLLLEQTREDQLHRRLSEMYHIRQPQQYPLHLVRLLSNDTYTCQQGAARSLLLGQISTIATNDCKDPLPGTLLPSRQSNLLAAGGLMIVAPQKLESAAGQQDVARNEELLRALLASVGQQPHQYQQQQHLLKLLIGERIR